MTKKLLQDSSPLLGKGNSQKSVFKILLVAVLFLFGTFAYSQAVANDYVFSKSVSGVNYTPITGTSIATASFAANGNSLPAATIATAYPLGFNFVYNNTSYSNVYISDNGFVYFNPVAATAPTNTYNLPISTNPTTGSIAGAIVGLGWNLNWVTAELPDISYLLSGVPGSQVFTIQYKNLRRYNGIGNGILGLVNFQIRLYEGSNKIEVEYQNFTGLATTQTDVQVGLRGVAITDFNNRLATASPDFFSSIAGTANNSVMPVKNNGTYYGPNAGTLFVWSPCFNPTTLVANLVGDTVNMSWTPPLYLAGSTYQWEIRTGGAPGSGATGLFLSGSASSPSVSVPGLTIGQLYYFYVRSGCKTIAPWPSTPTVDYLSSSGTPNCSTFSVPYYQDFESSVSPAIPLCTSVAQVSNQFATKSTPSLYGFTNKNLMTGGNTAYPGGSVAAANCWWFTPGLTLATGGTYKLTYKYGGTREQAFFTQKMKVAYGATASAAGMTVILADHSSIRSSPLTYTVNFVVPTGGTYYLGFNGYANANNGFLQVDDISLVPSTCLAPTGLSSGLITSTSAVISWTAPTSAPAGGYEFYYAPTATAVTPIGTTTPSGATAAGGVVTTLTGLTASTGYSYWVRSNCGGETSAWAGVANFTTTAPIPVPCTPAPSSVDGNGITNVTVGSINNTTGAEAGNYGNYTGLTTNIAQTTTVSVYITYQTLTFDYNTKIWIDWNNDGDFYDAGEAVASGLSTTTSPNTLLLTFVVPFSVTGVPDTAGSHRMRIGGADIDTLATTGPGQGPCYIGAWGTFEDYSVYVTVAPPALSVLDTNSSTSTSFCAGGTSPLVNVTSAFPAGTVYSWSPNTNVTGTIGTGFNFNPTTTTTYTLTATQSTSPYSQNTATYTVNVNPLPSPITITPTAPTLCEGSVQTLTATGGIISGVVVFSEDFNSATNTFTTINNSTLGTDPTRAAWTLYPSPYTTVTAVQTIRSNDNSTFYMSDSDYHGPGGLTRTELISNTLPTPPAPFTGTFDLTGFTQASLSFWHYYRSWINGTAKVEISTNGGTSYTTLPGATWSTVSQGTPTNFVNVVLDLAAYVGMSNLKIRFIYNTDYGYRWCIDNVKVTGSTASAVVWSPNTNLYTDPAATIAYNGTAQTSVIYAKPSTTTTYTATATTLAPASCPTTTNVTVTVTPLAGGTASGNQTIGCGSLPSNLTLSAYLPFSASNITGWQQSTSSTFPVGPTTTIVPGSANQATLTSAMMGVVSVTTYYRAIITGCNTVYSTFVTVTVATDVYTSGTWSLGSAPTSADAADISSGTLTIASNLSVCSLIIRAGANVIVDPGITLTVENAVTVVGSGTLTINDGGSLLQGASTTTNANTGNIIYKRNTQPLLRYDYTYWSSPVGIQTLSGIFSLPQQPLSDKYFWFRTGATPLYGWVNVATPGSTNMTVGQGYIIRAPQSFNITGSPGIANATFTGVPNNGDYDVNIVKTGANDLNCIGNPYPGAVSADLFVSDNAAVFTDSSIPPVVGTTFYFWTHNTPLTNNVYTDTDYATYNLTGGTATSNPVGGSAPPDGKIAAAQSFMVKGINNGTLVAKFKNDQRLVNNNGNFYRLNGHPNATGNTLEKHRVWLNLTSTDGAFKQTLIGYVENATNSYESAFDGDIIQIGNTLSLYSTIADKKLSVQGRALPFASTDEVPLGYNAPAVGTFTVTLSSFDGLFENTDTGIYIEDRLLNVIHDLRQSSYSFVSEAGVFDDRFVLRYSNSALAVNSVSSKGNAVIAYKKDNAIHVETSGITMKSVKIFDARGRMILAQERVNSNATVFTNTGIANQVFVIQVTSTEGTIVSKKIIF